MDLKRIETLGISHYAYLISDSGEAAIEILFQTGKGGSEKYPAGRRNGSSRIDRCV